MFSSSKLPKLKYIHHYSFLKFLTKNECEFYGPGNTVYRYLSFPPFLFFFSFFLFSVFLIMKIAKLKVYLAEIVYLIVICKFCVNHFPF